MDLRTAVLLTLISLSVTGQGSKTSSDESCVRLPETEDEVFQLGVFWTFHPSSSSLNVDLSKILKINNSCSEADRLQMVRVDLVSTMASGGKSSCLKPKKDSFVQSSVVVNATSTNVTFNHVQGFYYIRLAHCGLTKTGSCKMSKGEERRVFCVGKKRENENEDPKPIKFVADLPKSAAEEEEEDVCEFEVPTKISADIVDSTRNVTSVENVTYDGTRDDQCDINIRVVIPLCATRKMIDTVTLTLVDAEHGEACTFAEFESQEKSDESSSDELSRRIPLKPCNNEDADSNATTLQCGEVTNATRATAFLDHDVRGLARNSSYCLFFRLNSPHCQGQFGCVFYTEVISCSLIEGSRRHSYRMIVTEPVFIAGVSLTLVASLALLAWTVIQCSKKKPGTPLMTQTQIGMMKKPPRSLTEDDLEHISRLPSQEIVLVYFPDTNRFKELNRKLRNWLITLDVNDVKDIYDEKATEEVLRNPEQWVRDALAGPEKRIILVCSRLAFECLTAIKRGISSPRFVESDPHFGLLTRTVQYLDREMRGNYRNLICVRYEDLKICSRQYSSEAFNLVPGTEYVLPQHLEDIYRWIHPRQPDPDCWSETRPEVRDLLEAIRQYRHHDDNIFTVQFSATNMICSEQ